LGIIFVGDRVAKVHEEPIPEQLGDMSFRALDDLRTDPLIRTDDFAILFGVELGREFGGIDQVAEHDRELPTFRVGRRWCSWERENLWRRLFLGR